MTTRKQSQKKPQKSKSAKQAVKTETCFVIMPFGSYFDEYYESIYIPAIESTGLTAMRADALYRPGTIVNDIWTLTRQAKIVLADLSTKNANVYYELGLAHAIAKPAILVADSIEDVPFDLRALRIIVYDKNKSNWGRILRHDIEIAINEVKSSPLEAVLPAFLKVKNSKPSATVTKTERDLISMKQDLELLKHDLQVRTMMTSPFAKPFGNTEESTEYVRFHLANRAPESFIVRRLEERGISRGLALELIQSVKNELKLSEDHAPENDEVDERS